MGKQLPSGSKRTFQTGTEIGNAEIAAQNGQFAELALKDQHSNPLADLSPECTLISI
jgi:hypothetical protein